MFEYIWTSLDQPVDSVKHNTKSFIKNIIESLLAGSKKEIVDQFLKDTMKLPLIQLYTRSSSQAVTNCLISVLNSQGGGGVMNEATRYLGESRVIEYVGFLWQ